MKVIHVITSTDVGGAQIMLSRYLRCAGIDRRSHSVISLIRTGPIARELADSGIRVSTLDMAPGGVSPGAVRALRRKFSAEAPDIVFGWMYHGCLAALTGRAGLRDTALVWGIHHSLADIRTEKRSTRMMLRTLAALSSRADAISYCSDNSRQQHEAIGFSPMLSTVIPNAVDTAEFRPDASAASRLAALCRIPAGREIVGTVGRCHPMKDHVAMIRAVARLIADGRDVHAVLLGAGQPEGPAAAEARALGIADRVSCLDNRSDVASLVAGFDVFLLPSAWGEAFPLAVAEAMAAGVPCIVTDVGDCGMLVGTEGTVVPPGDVGAMTRALHDWLDLDPAARETAGRAARARVATHFSFDRYVDAHERLYADAMAQRLGTGSRRLRSQAG